MVDLTSQLFFLYLARLRASNIIFLCGSMPHRMEHLLETCVIWKEKESSTGEFNLNGQLFLFHVVAYMPIY